MPQRSASGTVIKRTDPYVLKASGAETSNTTGGTVETRDGGSVYVEVNVTATSGTPTMLVVIEGSVDSTNWFELGRFGSDGFRPGSVGAAPANFTATAGPIRGAVACTQFLRYRSVIGGGTPSLTYSVLAEVS